jgi:nitrite reductase (NO-forming)
MKANRIGMAAVAGAMAIGLGGWAAGSRGGVPAVQRVDFGVTKTAISPAYDARVLPAVDAPVKEFRIPITEDTVQIADGVKYEGWTFGGTVPGPVIRVTQGDLVRITLVNRSKMPHSIDFHAARIPMNEAFKSIMPGQEIRFQFRADDPGVFMVHCGTAPVLLHIMQGMYLPIIVDPRDGWGTRADREFVLVQSEFYAKPAQHDSGAMEPDYEAAQKQQASYVVFNGRAGQYQKAPLKVNVGDRVRIFVVNAGPSENSDFHIVGAIFDRVYPDGNPQNRLEHVQTWGIPAGGGAVFETVFDQGKSGEGMYAFVTHSFADASKGAVGMIQVGNPPVTGPMSH